jgi:engulfment/cell motility protein 1
MQGAWFPISTRGNTMAGSSGTASGTSDSTPSSNLGNTNTPALMNPSALIGGSSAHAMTIAASGTQSHIGYKWRYYKLSPSKKQLHYADFVDRITTQFKSYEKLTEKSKRPLIRTYLMYLTNNCVYLFLFTLVDISSIAEVQVTSKQSSVIPIAGQNTTLSSSQLSPASLDTSQQSFVLLTSSKAVIAEFKCSSSALFSEWTDGFSLLLDKGITSKDTAEYIHSLTEIGVKVKLLQIAGDRVEVPHGGLEIPVVHNGLSEGYWYQEDYPSLNL